MEQHSHHAWDANVHYQAHTAPLYPFQGFGETGEPYVVVGFSSPFEIINASQDWLDLFRFSREEVADRSIQIIQGPGTDFETISDLVAAGQCGKSHEATLTVYSSACQGMLLRVKSSPAINNGHVVGCVLTMHYSDAVSYKQACADDGTAKAVVSVSSRAVEYVSSGFNNLYGFQDGQLNGRTLRIIMGPNTDHRRWEELFNECSAGQSSSSVFSTCRNDCVSLDVNVQVRPVYSSGGCFTHILSTFAPAASNQQLHHPVPKAQDHASMADQHFRPVASSHDAPHPSAAPALPSRPSVPSAFAHPHLGASSEPAPSQLIFPGNTWTSSMAVVAHHTGTPTVFAGHAVPPLNALNPLLLHPSLHSNLADFFGLSQNQGASQANAQQQEKGDTQSKVFPRRKHGQDPTDSQRTPVLITLELLESFSSLSLTCAAAKLGISPTAVKKACRKLGVQRWPYRKHAEQQVEASVQLDDAYVRKLYRKYSKSGVTRTSSAASAASRTSSVALGHVVHEVAAAHSSKAESGDGAGAGRGQEQRDAEHDAEHDAAIH
eukprot:CAMPEP_0177716696 /NCGR_PEP_ID=MMETSP0484_2-20121128/14643_1 /TAXON_ID=354590 /ORGANISM="Rhodomonas lens, Strain RHODO" /LENGTH=547 /DNA_ID=CAMNT_0019228735 /DNA_START=106 /DNA_END=1746 /DNA_ORIENTATION=-